MNLYLVVAFVGITLPYILTNEINDIGYFWQISDIHLELNYASNGCKGSLGDYKCDSPLDLVYSAMNYTKVGNSKIPIPDFVVFSGDSVAHGVSSDRVPNTMATISSALKAAFPTSDVPLLPVLGNHDLPRSNYFKVNSALKPFTDWCKTLAENTSLWGDWLKDKDVSSDLSAKPPASDFSKGCYTSRLLKIKDKSASDKGKFLLMISLNGMLWYKPNSGSDKSIADPFDQFAWLESSLIYARNQNIKVLLVCHFPPGATENSPEQYRHFYQNYNHRILGLLSKYSDLLIAGLFGHQHADSFRLLTDTNGNHRLSLFITPSIAPFNLRGLGSFNPRIRAYSFSRSSLKLLGYRQFFLDLRQPTPNWSLEYDFNVEYNLSDASPHSLNRLLTRFATEESSVWCKYWQHQLGGLPHESGDCPSLKDARRCSHLCAMRKMEYSELDACLEACALVDEVGSQKIYIIVPVIVSFLILLIGVVVCVNRDVCKRRSGNSVSVNGIFFNSPHNLPLNQQCLPTYMANHNISSPVSDSLSIGAQAGINSAAPITSSAPGTFKLGSGIHFRPAYPQIGVLRPVTVNSGILAACQTDSSCRSSLEPHYRRERPVDVLSLGESFDPAYDGDLENENELLVGDSESRTCNLLRNGFSDLPAGAPKMDRVSDTSNDFYSLSLGRHQITSSPSFCLTELEAEASNSSRLELPLLQGATTTCKGSLYLPVSPQAPLEAEA